MHMYINKVHMFHSYILLKLVTVIIIIVIIVVCQ